MLIVSSHVPPSLRADIYIGVGHKKQKKHPKPRNSHMDEYLFRVQK